MRARVWNDNAYPHQENFKGKVISIASKEFVEMDYDDAKELEGQFTPIRTDGEKNPLPQYFKMIRVEPINGSEKPLPERFVCHATGKVAGSADELKKMLAENEHLLESESKKYLDDKKALEDEVEALRAELAAAKEKRGPGRPKKEAS